MGREYESIDERWKVFIETQPIFFVASAPLSAEGHVNLSPKGQDSLRVLGPRQVAYLDLAGSGIETVAHVRENGRIVIMVCAFEGEAKILRLYGRGRVVEPGDDEWDELSARFPDLPGRRSIILVDVTRIRDACGFGVPVFEYKGQRTRLGEWALEAGEAALRDFETAESARSLDGLPGLPAAVRRAAKRDPAR